MSTVKMKEPSLENLFEKNNPQLDDLNLPIDGVDMIDIDTDALDKESQAAAEDMIANLSKLCGDEEFIKNNPAFKKRVDAELESMRILIKMRKSDEVAHDLLLKAIGGNSGNASLYRALSEIQKTILAVTTKITDIINGLNTLMKGYQLELDFKENAESDEEEKVDSKATFRGSKDFIKAMNDDEEQTDENITE